MKYQFLAVYFGILCLLTSTCILASESRGNENTTNHGLNSRLVVMVNPMSRIPFGTLNYDHYYQALNSSLDKMSTLQSNLSARIESFSSQGNDFMMLERASTDYSEISQLKIQLEQEIIAATGVVYRLGEELAAANVRSLFSVALVWKSTRLKIIQSKLRYLKNKSYLTMDQYEQLTAPTPAPAPNLERLNELILTSAEIPLNGECAICIEVLKDSELPSENEADSQAVVKTDCGHLFHFDCLKPWLEIERGRNSCPECRQVAISSPHQS